MTLFRSTPCNSFWTRRDQSTVGGPKWTILVHFGLAKLRVLKYGSEQGHFDQKMVVLAILDHVGPVHLPAVPWPLLTELVGLLGPGDSFVTFMGFWSPSVQGQKRYPKKLVRQRFCRTLGWTSRWDLPQNPSFVGQCPRIVQKILWCYLCDSLALGHIFGPRSVAWGSLLTILDRFPACSEAGIGGASKKFSNNCGFPDCCASRLRKARNLKAILAMAGQKAWRNQTILKKKP